MGLKWFRARLTMNRMPKATLITSVSGFYRSISQFDTEIRPPEPTYSQEIWNSPSTSAAPITSPRTIAHNPMAGLNSRKIESTEVPSDIVSIPRLRLEIPDDAEPITTNEEPESPGESVPRHLPRESLDLMHDLNTEASFNRTGSRSRKVDFKKKKARAPVPKSTMNHSRGGERFITFGKNGGSAASEIEI